MNKSQKFEEAMWDKPNFWDKSYSETHAGFSF